MNAVQITEGKYPSGNPRWLVQAFVGGKRIRRYFSTEDAALAEKNRIERSSLEALEIPEAILHEAWQCHRDLRAHGWTLRRAADYVLGNVIRFQDQPIVRTLIDEYLREEKTSGIADATLTDLRSRLRKFGLRFGDRKAHEISSEDIKRWHADMAEIEKLDPQSRTHYLNKASQFFLWCIRNKKCLENPLDAVKRPKVVRKTILFYNAEQCRVIMKTVPDRFYFYVVLALILGIRPEELRRLRSKHIKHDGDRMVIVLDADVTKASRRRVIELEPGDPLGEMALAWLRMRSVPERVFDGNSSTYKRHFRRWRATLQERGVVWLRDGLRHTAASMHYAQYRSIEETAALLGDGTRIVFDHYRGLAIQAEAKGFYGLRPTVSHGDSTAIGICSSAKEDAA